MLGIHHTLFLLTLAASFASVSSSLYPTFPIVDTVWSGGRTECVTWIDDGPPPHLQDLGRLDVELYVNGQTHVATLATNVSPDSKFHKFKVLPSWGPDSHNYHVRFVSHQPPHTYYTADFSIRDMEYNSTATFSTAEKDKEKEQVKAKATSTEHIPSTTSSASLYTPVMTLVLPDTTITSTLAPTTPKPTPSQGAPLAAAAITTPPPSSPTPAVVIQPDQDVEPEHAGTISGSRKSKSSATSTRRVDMEKLKFRVVFILWPVLIGLSMAL